MEPAILMYHRIADLAYDPWDLAVSPAHFAVQLRRLKKSRTILPMDAFIAGLREKRLPRDAVAITFDDGYIDNLRHAAPALAAESVPATLFLTSGPMMRGRPYWWDELAAMLLDAQASADVSVDLGSERWRIAFGKREPQDQDRKGWLAWHPPRTQREASYFATWTRFRTLSPLQCEAAMEQLRPIFPVRTSEDSRPANREEVVALLEPGHFSLGSHTADHADLLALDDEAAFQQIVRGKAEAEDIAGRPVTGFAYPYGLFDDRIKRLTAAAGIEWACTASEASVGRRTEFLELPRIAVGNWDEPAFAAAVPPA